MKDSKITIKCMLKAAIIAATALLMAYPMIAKASEVKAEYLYNLSNFTGTIPYNWVRLYCDTQQNEVYVVNPTDRSIRIFDGNGMEVYSFGDDEGLGDVSDVAVGEDGDLLMLSYIAGKYSVIHADFRGEIKSRVGLTNLPAGLSTGFNPSNIIYKDGHIYLVDKGSMKVLVTGRDGAFETLHDLGSVLGFDEKKRADTGIAGFSLDGEGDMLFTIPTLFTAYVVSPDHKVRTFGTRGSSPGKFNIAGGISRDGQGNYFVVDTLRGVVIVFDKDFKFRSEFGYWGSGPGNLISPMDIAVSKDKVYVTQSRGRGISVYRVETN
jgi:hypothetical protein